MGEHIFYSHALVNEGGRSSPLPCIVCGKELRNAIPNHLGCQPVGGTVFKGQPTYGSSFDGISEGKDLCITVCDECLGAASTEQKIGLEKAKGPTRSDNAN